MNDETLQDLKQFITATVSQQISSFGDDISEIRSGMSDIRSDIVKLDDKLSAKIDDLSSSVAEAIDVSNEETDKQLKDHAVRITKLEQKTA